MKTKLRQLGDQGEKIAENFLVNKGFEILERNWSCREGELDLVTKKNKELVFVEVKTRKSEKYGTGAESVSDAKLEKILLACEKYLLKNQYSENTFWRVDVIVIGERDGFLQVISHLENVTV